MPSTLLIENRQRKRVRKMPSVRDYSQISDEGARAWIMAHDAVIDGYWKVQHDWNKGIDAKLEVLAGRVTSVDGALRQSMAIGVEHEKATETTLERIEVKLDSGLSTQLAMDERERGLEARVGRIEHAVVFKKDSEKQAMASTAVKATVVSIAIAIGSLIVAILAILY